MALSTHSGQGNRTQNACRSLIFVHSGCVTQLSHQHFNYELAAEIREKKKSNVSVYQATSMNSENSKATQEGAFLLAMDVSIRQALVPHFSAQAGIGRHPKAVFLPSYDSWLISDKVSSELSRSCMCVVSLAAR